MQTATQAPASPIDPATTHPSRTAPLCANCTHQLAADGKAIFCTHPATPIDPVTGDPMWRAYQMRAANSPCGPQGLLHTRGAL